MLASFDRADDKFLDPLYGLIAMIRVYFICGISADEMENCERTTGMFVKPGLGDT
jgi:hypothetical protein